MIIVSGAKRSGTSMWMQILAAAGFPVIGEAFPGTWGSRLSAANPRGFYESLLSSGIYFRTNPHPRTGQFLFPEQVEGHCVKVFAPGLVRTDFAFIDRVIVTIRPWREYVASMNAMRRVSSPLLGASPDELAGLDRSRQGIEPLHPALEWWSDNFALVRDVATRRYPVHFQSYPALLADPKRTIEATLEWIGGGDVEAGVAEVTPDLHHQRENELDERELLPEGIAGGDLTTFDALFEAVHATRSLEPDLVRRLNATNDALLPFFLEQQATLRERALGADLDALDLAEPTGRGSR